MATKKAYIQSQVFDSQGRKYLMAKDHYLPAAYIGRFSEEYKTGTNARRCRVWAAHVGAQRVNPQSAESLGFVKGLYDMVESGPGPSVGSSVDHWKYESDLPCVLDALCAGNRLLLADWLHVAVPFVAGLFSRGIDFDMRYQSRLKGMSFSFKNDVEKKSCMTNVVNFSRLVEMQSLLLPVMAARWKIIHSVGSFQFVLNDLGITPLYDSATALNGWMIPLGLQAGLMLLPRKSGCFGSFSSDGCWYAVVEHMAQEDLFFEKMSEATAKSASRFVVGAQRNVIDQLLPLLSAKAETDLHFIRESDWHIHKGISASGDDCMWWGCAAAIADNAIKPVDLPNYRPSINDLDYARYVPRSLILQEPGTTGNGGIAYSGRNLYVKPLVGSDGGT